MIRKVAIVLFVLVLLVVMGWLLRPPNASVAGCKFESQPVVTLEAGTFFIEGEVEYVEWKTNFRPGPGHDPRIKLAAISPVADWNADTASNHHVRGTLRIDRASDTELVGRLELSTPDAGARWGPARVSSLFAVELVEGETEEKLSY